ncbi:hypothetical protein ACGFSD_05760 [Streptomyces caniferus]|uniref:hypothetical protein n=1 Tax=Streptomyces caniferus TaxID=285557 RepID=UPI0037126CA7
MTHNIKWVTRVGCANHLNSPMRDAGGFSEDDVEGRLAGALQVLGGRGRDHLPLHLAVGERLVCAQLPVVRTEQRPQIPTRHTSPLK